MEAERERFTREPASHPHLKEDTMKHTRIKPLAFVAVLIIVTGAAMAYTSRTQPAAPAPPVFSAGTDGVLALSGHLVQTHVLKGSHGRVSLELSLAAAPVGDGEVAAGRGIDFVVVLDRSGSMQGAKIDYARRSLLNLLADLTERDRFALFSYSDTVRRHCDLLAVTDRNRHLMESAVEGVFSGGATNLGEGLRAGIELISAAVRPGHPGRVVLISDGLANRGVTDPAGLGRMAAAAAGSEFAVSTVGVGADFNEFLMTTIADRGAGTYYYLENPAAFAEAFGKELLAAQSAAATGIAVSIHLPPGVRLMEAAGYPVTLNGQTATFHPGPLRSGQTRKVYLTLQVPTGEEKEFAVGRVTVRYQRRGESHETALEGPFIVACVGDEDRVASSIDRTRWEKKVLTEDYNRLKQEVAASVSAGNRDEALERIGRYEKEQRALNSVVRSPGVSENLEKDVNELRRRVDLTFQGPPAQAAERQKSSAKALQYEGYSNRRMH
jgi:Ca-activated chloride channel family protein